MQFVDLRWDSRKPCLGKGAVGQGTLKVLAAVWAILFNPVGSFGKPGVCLEGSLPKWGGAGVFVHQLPSLTGEGPLPGALAATVTLCKVTQLVSGGPVSRPRQAGNLTLPRLYSLCFFE